MAENDPTVLPLCVNGLHSSIQVIEQVTWLAIISGLAAILFAIVAVVAIIVAKRQADAARRAYDALEARREGRPDTG